MISCVVGINKIPFIGLFNEANSYCHYVAVLQRLHGSAILTKYLRQFNSWNDLYAKININILRIHDKIYKQFSDSFDNIEQSLAEFTEYIHVLIEPLLIYSKYEPQLPPDDVLRDNALVPYDNTKESAHNSESLVYTQLMEYFPKFISKYVAITGDNGYYPERDFKYLLLPIVYVVMPEMFEDFIIETGVRSTGFVVGVNTVHSSILGDDCAFLNKPYRYFELNLYELMINEKKEFLLSDRDYGPFVITTLDVYADKHGGGGHAIALLRGYDNKLYILDDQFTIETLEQYYIKRTNGLYEISVRDVDYKTILEINRILKGVLDTCYDEVSFTQRVSRYVMRFDNKLVYDDGINVPLDCIGVRCSNYFNIRMLLMFIGCIIVVVFIASVIINVVRSRRNGDDYKLLPRLG